MFLAMTILASGLVSDPAQEPQSNWSHAAEAINSAMREYHYNPAELDHPRYREIEIELIMLGETAENRDAFLSGFSEIWADAPFSHVRLSEARGTAAETAAYLDQLRVGGGGAQLSWVDDIAVLTVNTMMGLDTIEEIDAAYDEIAQREAAGLVIDLRQNEGGAFAVKPLVEHVLAAPLEAGLFVSQPWNAAMDRAPILADAVDVEPWEGWSIRAFWQDVQVNPITRLQFRPETSAAFDGPVYVLTSARTASAAEMAADALKASGRAVLIGEVTAGQMLSQTMYDIPGGLQLALPVADYYSITYGRIEGEGVTPHLIVTADNAMDEALNRLR